MAVQSVLIGGLLDSRKNQKDPRKIAFEYAQAETNANAYLRFYEIGTEYT